MPFRFGTRQSLGLGLVGGGGGATLKPQDVILPKLYTGNDTGQKIALPFAPDFLWTKVRSEAGGHGFWSRGRSARKYLLSNTTDAEATAAAGNGVVSFDADGFTLGGNWIGENRSTTSVIAWAMKFAAGFAVEVTWMGDGTSNRQIPHGLGVVPGMIIVKCRSSAQEWRVTHRSLPNPFSDFLVLNDTAGVITGGASEFTGASATTFGVSGSNRVNVSGQTYVAYLFAHDPSADGIVQCGSFTASASTTVNLGWRPQFLLGKITNAGGGWALIDAARGFSSTKNGVLYAQNSNAEAVVTGDYGSFTDTGFIEKGLFTNPGDTVIYLAIRAPY